MIICALVTRNHPLTFMPNLSPRWATGLAALALLLALAILFFRPDQFFGSPTFEVSDLSRAERLQLSELILNVAEEPKETLPKAKEIVWAIFGPHGTPSASAQQELEQVFLKIGQGPRLFWLDAQQAIQEQRPIKGPERTQWEADLLSDGWLSLAQQRRYEEFMARLAGEEPIESTHGIDIVVDEKIVQEIVQSWDEDELRQAIRALLTST